MRRVVSHFFCVRLGPNSWKIIEFLRPSHFFDLIHNSWMMSQLNPACGVDYNCLEINFIYFTYEISEMKFFSQSKTKRSRPRAKMSIVIVNIKCKSFRFFLWTLLNMWSKRCVSLCDGYHFIKWFNSSLPTYHDCVMFRLVVHFNLEKWVTMWWRFSNFMLWHRTSKDSLCVSDSNKMEFLFLHYKICKLVYQKSHF